MTDSAFTQPPSLFDAPPTGRARELGQAGLASATANNVALLDRLIPVAQECARSAGAEGVTVTDVRKLATERGILSGSETRSQLSALGSLMKAAGLIPRPLYRASDLDSTHARPQRVWRMA